MRLTFEWKCEVPLRDYQKSALDSIEEGFSRAKSLLISVPTGGGKTVIFNTYALNRNFRTLVVAHRDELIEQALDKYVMVGGSFMDCGRIVAGRVEPKKYTAGSIQTLHRNLDRLTEYFKSLDLVVWDEAHHVPARTYREVYERIREVHPEVRMLGVTATPFRTDGQNLQEFFEEQAFSIGLFELMKLGYLVPLRGRRIPLDLELDRVGISEGEAGEKDFSVRGLGELIMQSGVLPSVARLWQEFGENRRTIFFLPTVETAHDLKEELLRIGVAAEVVYGSMELKERRSILQEFKNGGIRVLTNVNVLTEGFDDPEVDCIAMLRPTKSLVLYAQIVGRGLRLARGKRDCLLLDFTGISEKHEIVGLEHLFGVEREDIGEVIAKGLAGEEEVVVGAYEEEDGKRELKVFVGGKVEDFSYEGRDAMQFATELTDGRILLSCGMNKAVLVMEKDRKGYRISLVQKERVKVLKEKLPEDYAWTVLNALWKHLSDEFMAEFSKRAKEQRPTEKQVLVLSSAIKGGLLPEIPLDSLSRLDASHLISYLFATTKEKFYEDPVKEAQKRGYEKISDWPMVFYHRQRNAGFVARSLSQVRELMSATEELFEKRKNIFYATMKYRVKVFLTNSNGTITLISPRGMEKRTLPANAPLPLIEEIAQKLQHL